MGTRGENKNRQDNLCIYVSKCMSSERQEDEAERASEGFKALERLDLLLLTLRTERAMRQEMPAASRS